MGQKKLKKTPVSPKPYPRFDKINGKHPWAEQVEEGHVPYQVRTLDFGTTTYFNFNLAKEMGLLPESHPNRITKELNQKILSTFCLRIINEYDLEHQKEGFKNIKPNTYMASRYLQLQHKDKRGLSSGDGRGIWNGTLKHKGIIWDISSRGTGVTCLSPGSVSAGKNLQTGSEEFGYGCGLAEVDELIGTSIMSETLHNFGFTTERMLALIDFGNGCGIGVRAGKNLIRPAHLFLHLKQNNHLRLKQATDYLIDRQIKNKEWKFSTNSNKKYDLMLKELCRSFAQFSAHLEREYLFTWLDWDGDNVLANAGLIDYGSIRLLGLRHDKYRYDDVERYSTTLNEQKNKARFTIQVFAQLVDFLNTQEKKPINEFKEHTILQSFDKYFEYYKLEHFLFQIGMDHLVVKKLMGSHQETCKKLLEHFTFFEKLKSSSGPQEVEDGINHPPILNMRSFLRLMPDMLVQNELSLDSPRVDGLLFEICSEFANPTDISYLEKQQGRFNLLIKEYVSTITKIAKTQSSQIKNLSHINERSKIINREDRVTGNALVFIVQKLILQNKTTSSLSMQKIIEGLIQKQQLTPDNKPNKSFRANPEEQNLLKSFDNLILLYKEDL